MRVCYLMPTLSRKAGGLLTSVSCLAQAVAELPDTRVAVFGAEDEFTQQDDGDWGRLERASLPRQGPGSFAYMPQLRQKIDDFAPDIGHTEGLWQYTSVAMRKWSQRSGRSYLISPHGMLDPWAVRNSGWKKKIAAALFERAHLDQAACLHALCEPEAQSIRDYGLKNPVAVIPNGIDLPDTSSEALKAEWEDETTEGKKALLYLGRIHRKKGLIPLAAAWNVIHTETVSKEWILVIAGWEQEGHQQELQELLTDQASKSVRFIGPQFGEAKAQAYCRADAYILPSFSEGLPMTVLEAWAYQLPVIMTDYCNLPEGFQAKAALRAEPTKDSLLAALRQLFGMADEERQNMALCGRTLVEERFTWPTIAASMHATYAWCLGDAEAPPCLWPNQE